MPGLRIHDINVVADLNAHDPTVVNPCDVELDGTTEGNGWSSISTNQAYTTASEKTDESLQSVWQLEIFWPVLHTTASVAVGVLYFILHYSVDLIDNYKLIQSESNTPEDEFLSDWLEVFIAVGLTNALFQTSVALLAVGEFTMRAPEPCTKWLIGAGVALMVSTVAMAAWYAESRIIEGSWHHGQAFAFYIGLAITMGRYLIGLKGVRGLISGTITSLLLLHMGASMATLSSVMEKMAKPLRWTKLVILAACVFMVIMAFNHWAAYKGY